jgi:ribosomal protein S18 acetylase RimI-like enzyme
MQDRYLIRRFQPERDLEAAYNCFVSGFHHILWPVIDEAEPRLVKDIILAMHGAGDYTLVAEEEGEARGLLVGCFVYRPNLLRKLWNVTEFGARFGARRYEMSTLAYKCLLQVLWGYLPFLYLHKFTPSETLLLTSQKEYRGGVGRAMMDGWIKQTREAGYRHSTVCTDSELSWDFYERYGFERVRDFPLRSYKYSMPEKYSSPEKKPTAYIYSLRW